jgi:DNA-binding NtrC family response regulator
MRIGDRFSAASEDHLLFGSSEPMQALRERVLKIADAIVPVLIQGESGVGKERLAEYIHRHSSRRDRQFLKINCSGDADLTAFERLDSWSTLEPPATSKITEQVGTILLDNVGELRLAQQVQVVAFLDSRIVEQVQLICISNVPLELHLRDGNFREDLYHRINVIKLHMPSLRERRVDIPLLALQFLQQYSTFYERSIQPFSSRLMQLLLVADWPGNLRQLEGVVKQYVLLGSEESVIADLQKQTTLSEAYTDRARSLKALRREARKDCDYKAILVSLSRNRWNRRQTARELQISYRSLLDTMRELGLPAKRRHDSSHGR